MNFRCLKCGSDKYYVKTAVFPEKDAGLKIEMGTYYLKICAECGYTEMYSAKIINKDVKKSKEEIFEPKTEPGA